MGGQRAAGTRAISLDQIENPGRHTGSIDHLGEKMGRERGEFAGFQNTGAARRHCRRDLCDDLVDRPIPGRDQSRDTNRFGQNLTAAAR